ncbi:MAG: hypothetical protein R3E32_24055 [Chitinophagales bacterium]
MNTIKHIFLACIILTMSACANDSTNNSPAKENSANTPTDTKSTPIQTAKATYQAFHSKVKPYTLYIPIGWTVKAHNKSGALDAKAPEKTDTIDYQATILLNMRKARMAYNEESKKMEVQPMDLSENAKEYMEGLQRNFDEMNVSPIEDTKVGDEIGKVFTYTYLKEDEFVNRIKAATYIFQHNSETYILTFKEEAKNFEAMQPIFEEIKNSFQFKSTN